MRSRLVLLCLTAGLSLATGCQQQPLIAGQGVAFGGRLDTIYVLRGDDVVQVGNISGENIVGATPIDELFTAEGRPIGGAAIPAVFQGTLPLIMPPDGGADMGGIDGFPGDGAMLGDGGTGVVDLAAVDLASNDLSAADDMSASGDGGTVRPDPGEGPSMDSATARVRLLDWLFANFEFQATPVDSLQYEVHIKAKKLIPNGLYSAWVQYLISVPNPILYAIAPLGGLPCAFIADENGDADVRWRVSSRMFEQLQSIPNAIAVGNSGIPKVVTPATTIVLTLMYHSSGQLSGNASFPADPSPNFQKPATEIPPNGTVGVPGHVGIDVHPHVSSFPMQTVPRQNP